MSLSSFEEMLNRGTDALVDVEAGYHLADIGHAAKAEDEGHITSQSHKYACAVRSGSQSSSPTPSVTQMPVGRNASKSSVVDEAAQSGPHYRPKDLRPPSCATEDGMEVTAASVDMPFPDLIQRVGTFDTLRQQTNINQPPREKVKTILCIPRPTKRVKENLVDFGNVELHAEEPGPWVVDHHLSALVLEIVPPPGERFQQRVISWLRAKMGKSHQANRIDEDGNAEQTFRVSFAEMQRMHLRKLQVGLVKHAVTMYTTKDETQDWEKDLAAYIQAMKDYDYMTECSKRPRDHFLATGERSIDHYVTRRVITDVLDRHNQLGSLDKLNKDHPLGPWEYDGQPIGGTRNRTLKAMSFNDFRDRLFLAAVGAALLLGPMWLMVLHNTLYTGLIATTVCVAVFGLVVVFRLEKPMDVLSTTAAYAAVLVVFVGLTTDS